MTTLAAITSDSQRLLAIALFLGFVGLTLWITVSMGRKTKNADDFYAAGRSIGGIQNGIAISGDYMSAASFLGIAGLIALYGYDGFLYSVGFLVAYLVVLLFVAEPLRNSGKYTMADVLAYRLTPAPGAHRRQHLDADRLPVLPARADGRRRRARVAAARHHRATRARASRSRSSALLMIIYVLIGGMKATTWVQIIKAVAAHGRRR